MSFKGWFGFSKESHKRPHSIDRHGYNHSPYPPYYPNSPHQHHAPPTQNGRFPLEKAQDVSAPQAPISDQFLQKLIVLQDYTASRDTEMSIRRGEKIEVVQREGDWLFIRNERGKEGFVPAKNCAPPVASSSRRTRSNSRSSIPLRSVASGETGSRGSIPMFPSSSAGHVVKRYDSPFEDSDVTIRRTTSPPSNVLSPLNSGLDAVTPREGSVGLDPKHSPSSSSGVASLSEPYSPAMVRSYLPDELKPQATGYSHSQCDPLPSDLTSLDHSVVDPYRKHSSSDDSGTMDLSQSKDNASTIRNGELSSDDNSSRQGRESSTSGGPSSVRGRPLPSPPKLTDNARDTPPPVPPRFASLDRSKSTGLRLMTADDVDPYAQPVDTIQSDSVRPSLHRVRAKSHVDINHKDSGIDSPYSEVYRGNKGNKRPINLPEDSPGPSRRASSFTRHRSPNSVKAVPHGIERQGSPQVNGDKRHRPQPLNGDRRLENGTREGSPVPFRGVIKFRKCNWGVFVCTQDFDGCDENEVCVRKGEHVLVFNQEDSHWFWVVKHKTDNSEGFVPSSILTEVGTLDSKGTTEVSENTVQFRPSSAVPHLRSRTSTSHYPPSSPVTPNSHHRSRVNSAGNSSMKKVQTLPSMERIAQNKALPLSPSSPPPPYAEKDPITQKPPISRNRPSYPGPRGRVSIPHPLYPSAVPNAAMSHISRSSTHLASAQLDIGYSPVNTPTLLSPSPVVGGTLV